MGSDGRGRQPRPGTPAGPATILTPAVPAQQRRDDDQYDFLVGSVIEASDLQRATAEAACCGVATHEALLAMGLASAPAYVSALARTLGVTLAPCDTVFDLKAAGDPGDQDSAGLPATINGVGYRVLC